MKQFKLGKKPARPHLMKFKLSDFVDYSKLPKPPTVFGHEKIIPQWDMLGNDKYGCCVFAGSAHETMMWNKEAGRIVPFNDKAVLSDYSTVTGFNPNDPNSDQGTDMLEAASYRRKVGIVDATGQRHKIAAYLSIKAGDLKEHLVALYLFGAVGIGINFPSSAMEQFDKGKKWSVVRRSPLEGGHYIPLVAKRKEGLVCVTWGKLQPMTLSFFREYNDESVVFLSEERLINRKSSEGFDYDKLVSCLNTLK